MNEQELIKLTISPAESISEEIQDTENYLRESLKRLVCLNANPDILRNFVEALSIIDCVGRSQLLRNSELAISHASAIPHNSIYEHLETIRMEINKQLSELKHGLNTRDQQ